MIVQQIHKIMDFSMLLRTEFEYVYTADISAMN